MDGDSIPLSNRLLKYCPACSSTNVVVYDDILLCHKCYRQFNAFSLPDDDDIIFNEVGE